MRVFKDYKDFLENKVKHENGVSRWFLNNFYDGDLEEAKKDNKSNMNCFNCYKCYKCYKCYDSKFCNDSNDCFNCFNRHGYTLAAALASASASAYESKLNKKDS